MYVQSRAQSRVQQSMAQLCSWGSDKLWQWQFADIQSWQSSPEAGSCAHTAAGGVGEGRNGGGTEIDHLQTTATMPCLLETE